MGSPPPDKEASMDPVQVSPFLPLKQFFRLARLVGGFPIMAVDEAMSEFKFEKKSYIFLVCCAILLVGNIGACFFITYVRERPMWRITDYVKEFGMSTTDAIASLGLYFPTLVLTVSFAVSYINAAPLTTEFCQKFISLRGISISKERLSGVHEKTMRRINYIYVCVFAATILNTVVYAQVLIVDHRWDASAICIYVMYFMGGLFVYFPLIIAASYATLCQVLGSLDLALQDYNQLILDETATNEDLIHIGHQMVDLIGFANQTYGPMMIFEYVTCTLFIVIGYFFGISMFSAFSNGHLILTPFLNGLSCFLLGVFATIRVYAHNLGGQKMCRQTTNAKRHLQKYISKHYWSLTPENMDQYQAQVQYLSKPAPIRPMDVFDLNWSSALSLYGLMLTYVIVLLQFKLGE